MKRIALSLAACALALGLVSAVRADEPSGSTSNSSTTTSAPKSEASAPAAKATTPAKHSMHHRAAHVTPVDLNAASKEDLMKLPGVTEATADKIIGARPFKSSTELRTKSIVTRAEWSKISSRIVVKKES